MIFYESPHRTAATLADFVQIFGADRRGTVSRELTKLHEEVRRGTLAELAEWAESERVRGEIVIIVEGAQAPETPEAQDVVQLVLDRVAGGERLKSACAAVAAETGTSKRDLYEAALAARSEITQTPAVLPRSFIPRIYQCVRATPVLKSPRST